MRDKRKKPIRPGKSKIKRPDVRYQLDEPGIYFQWKKAKNLVRTLYVTAVYSPMNDVISSKSFFVGYENSLKAKDFVIGIRKAIAYKRFTERKIKHGEGFDLLHYSKLPPRFNEMVGKVKTPNFSIEKILSSLE